MLEQYLLVYAHKRVYCVYRKINGVPSLSDKYKRQQYIKHLKILVGRNLYCVSMTASSLCISLVTWHAPRQLNGL